MAGRISLDDLKHKPMPNKKQKLGVDVFYGEKSGLDKVVLDKEPSKKEKKVELEEPEVKENPKPAHSLKVVDQRDVSKIDRKTIMDRLMSKNAFSIVKPRVPVQMSDLPKDTDLPDEEPLPKKLGKIVIKADAKESEDEKDKESDKEPKEKIVAIKKPKLKVIREDKAEGDKAEESDKAEGEHVVKIKKPVEQGHSGNVDLNTAKINGMAVIDRIPKTGAVATRASSYYMNNRKAFIEKLGPLFADYKPEDAEKASCDRGPTTDFKLMNHQRVVREYLNVYSPYRGLLLYHGLGSGKTCSSIAIAEGLKSHNHIYVMTLASLKMNFFTEMKSCGDELYKRKQFWEFVSTEGKPDDIGVLSKALSLPIEYIRKRKGAWLVNVTKEPNFDELADSDQKAVDEQIDAMIRSKYTDINYNGLNRAKLDALTHGNSRNPFDNSTVIIDEAHNFVSRIVNKMGDKKSISYRLYEYLMSATNARIVLLSGTPIINYPNEIGILFNILRGYIKTWVFPVKITGEGKEKPSRENIVNWFERDGFNTYDYVEYSGDKVTITRNPFGFVNVVGGPAEKGKKKGGSDSDSSKNKKKTKISLKIKPTSSKKKNKTKKNDINKPFTVNHHLVDVNHLDAELEDETSETSELRREHRGPNGDDFELRGGGAFEEYRGVKFDATGNISDEDFVKRVTQILGKRGLEVSEKAVISVNHKALPDDSKAFLNLFVELDSKEMKNQSVFQRRILGLTSYFRNANPELLPEFVPSKNDDVYHFERVEMSDYQFGLYEEIRSIESKKEKQNKKNRAKQEKQGIESLFKIASTYRIASRTCCNFAFPETIERPKNSRGEYGVGEEDIGESDDEAVVDKKKRGKRGGSKKGEDEELEEAEIKVDETEEPVVLKAIKIKRSKANQTKKADLEEPEVDKESTAAVEGDEDEDSDQKEDEDGDKAQVNEDEDEEEEDKEQENEDEDSDQDEDEKDEEEIEVSKKDDSTFAARVNNALKDLKKDQSKYLSPEGLRTYSPKFLRILKNIQDKDHKGLHLVYSQFRTLEGIGILKVVLEANGFAEFKITKSGDTWDIVDQPDSEGKPRFALYTGTETAEEKEIIRNIYNSAWSTVPASIVSKIKDQGIENNFMGEVIKIFMITSSGAEGINLKNTRYVHIVEPYWHMVRLNQVIGRARRLCSHQDLPEELRTVQVFLYLAVLSPTQAKDEKHIELRLRDVSKLTKKSATGGSTVTLYDRYLKMLDLTPAVVTTDQMLLENALVKDRVNSQILHAVKETAMDCALYKKGNREENMVCYTFGKVKSNAYGSNPDLEKDIAEKDVVEVAAKTLKLSEITVQGKKYAFDKATKELYDYDDYESGEVGAPLGKLVKEGSGFKIELL